MESETVHGENIAVFEKARVNPTIEKYVYLEIKPEDGWDKSEADMVFYIKQDDKRLVDLSNTVLSYGIRVVKDDGTGFHMETIQNSDGESEIDTGNPKNEFAIPINCIFHTMWEGIDISYDIDKISSTGRNYPYKAFFDVLLLTKDSEKKNCLHLIGFAMDHDNYNATSPHARPSNRGLQERYEMTRNGKTFYMTGKFLDDLCMQSHLLPNYKDIRIELSQKQDDFRLMKQPKDLNAHMEIVNPRLRVGKVTLQNTVKEAMVKMFEEQPLQYPQRIGRIKTKTLSTEERIFEYQDIFNGMIANKLIIGFVNEEAYSGHPQKNPLYFANLDLTDASIMVGSEFLPSKGYKLDFSSGRYADALENLYRIFGKNGERRDIGVSREQFKEGLSLIAFDITPSTPGDLAVWGLPLTGSMDLNLTFKKTIPQKHELIMYGIFPGNLTIDNSGNTDAASFQLK